MAEEPKKDSGDVDSNMSSSVTETEINKTKKKKKKGIFSRIWNAIFRSHGDDFEKRLQHISKEEAAVLSRIRKRSQNWRRITRHYILLSVLSEVIAVGYAIMTTRTPDLNWKMRALRVLPMFLLPVLSFLIYSTLSSLNKMFDRKDQKTLERLRTERQAKIDELKEKTNYYITQQLIQRYDPDPAAKAAAATVLASKLGADSGLKVYVGDDSKSTTTGKSSDVEIVPSTGGLRNRKQSQTRASNADNTALHPLEEEMLRQTGFDAADVSQQSQLVVEHRDPTSAITTDGGWLARIAALLVGEDPTQSYALICGNCHMHNGLARKEDFPFITYYCPHCKALNQPKQQVGRVSESNSFHMSSSTSVVSDADVTQNARVSLTETVSGSNSPATPAASIAEAEKVPSGTGS
ncbi:hypothetical protein M9H77_20067 [Catharanthus roseus]|uniref:Uncharacterized protein n=1 Tax=Catharanthus roseus TaxID=4058 RepID=A0ACC0AIU9_CATRO|nr:hypothetical protein M9H77_20067 [Catharanthus roseus]